MLTELQRQGFSLQPIATVDTDEREAVRQEDNFVCNIAARVYWRTSADGKIVSVRGVYREEGCL
jgi:hypothetical protein